MTKTTHTTAITLGAHRGRPRVYLQGRYLLAAGFRPGRRVAATFGDGRVVLDLDADGERKVSSKRAGKTPVIDINSGALAAAFGDARSLVVRVRGRQITIERARTEAKKATRCRNGREGSLFSGGGLLSQAALQAGYTPAWACEIETVYAESFKANHPDATVHNQSVSELDVADLEPVELLTAGIPCQPFSSLRRNQGADVPEAHDLGDMVYWTLRVIDALNPATVIVEQVPGFLGSGAGHILCRALERMGYHVESQIVDPAKSGQLTGRRRAVVIATSDGAQVTWPTEKPTTATLGASLDDVADDAPDWFDAASKGWFFEHRARQAAKGNRFCGRALDADTTRVPAITKRYFSGQGGNAVVKHPTRPETFRWLRVAEVARLMGLPEGFVLPAAKTRAGEILGQGVQVASFAALIAGVC